MAVESNSLKVITNNVKKALAKEQTEMLKTFDQKMDRVFAKIKEKAVKSPRLQRPSHNS
jgi:uncharacterized membrane protein